ncbi:MAG: rod shape-determining protein MreD [Planctomycetota bacterium]|jgi:rod shape-determining protein MreD|nr:rod shape-determining protein MreD [Planctomycetota bacterium]
MNQRQISWPVLFQTAVILGLIELAGEIMGLWGRFLFRPDWFWCLAVFSALKMTPVSAMIAFALCGLIRDLSIGPRLGAAMFAYIVVGWIALAWNRAVMFQGWIQQIPLAGLGAFLAAGLRLALESGDPATAESLILALGQGGLTLVVYVPAGLFFSLSPLCPGREQSWFS